MTNADAQVQKLLRQQAAIARFGSFALRERDLDKILAEAVRVCAEGLSVPFSKVCRYRAEENDLLIVAGHGWQDGVVGNVVSRADLSSPQGRAFITGQPSIIDDLQKAEGFKPPPFYAAHGIVSIIDVIIKGVDDQPYGILEIDNDKQHDYDQYDINFLTGFANVLAEAVSTVARGIALQVTVDRMKALVAEKDRLLQEKFVADLQLHQAQKMEAVGQLTGGVAHDLNNILTVITGTIEILSEAFADRPELLAITRMIDDAAARGADLTQRLLAFARKQPLQPREVDVNALVIQTANLLRPTLGEQIEVHMMLADDTSHALIDPSQLTNAVLNLALNARDAMPDGGKLTIETRNVVLDEEYVSANSDVTAGNYVLVAVTDSGHGIPAAILNHVFEPFFTTKDVDKGSGLGLSMVYGFVKQSQGHIKIYSEEGHGTTVRIYLPQATDAALPAEQASQPGMTGGDETILVVEDDNLVRTFVIGQIQSLGYATLAAVNANEAMAVIEGPEKIDLLFTDMIMPGPMNGRQLADAALQRRASLKVLFTSGYSNEAIIHHGHLDAGVLLLAKPYRKSDLAKMIRAALAA
ncbi:MAG: ATP-binding protein [Bradyrhizobium sp.]|uniref:GAF domain-containing hybrid sensor histidine kinase/response regulator n=1 Tax=Bradyrhizobium sp. TaxID=376 RepID=UPI00271677D0|nr:ATP-binding protein [Bradyrhizobium sp.]MDO9562296.1 ATP-binding protein [Bradyrhizobium sp.]MDP3690377.1 ATP-binding protein [Bradyrhizobium sp.]